MNPIGRLPIRARLPVDEVRFSSRFIHPTLRLSRSVVHVCVIRSLLSRRLSLCLFNAIASRTIGFFQFRACRFLFWSDAHCGQTCQIISKVCEGYGHHEAAADSHLLYYYFSLSSLLSTSFCKISLPTAVERLFASKGFIRKLCGV